MAAVSHMLVVALTQVRRAWLHLQKITSNSTVDLICRRGHHGAGYSTMPRCRHARCRCVTELEGLCKWSCNSVSRCCYTIDVQEGVHANEDQHKCRGGCVVDMHLCGVVH